MLWCQKYNLLEYSDNYSKTSPRLWQYFRDDPSDNIVNSKWFEFKTNIAVKILTPGNTKDVKIVVRCL